uniref:Sterol uptake control protein 2 n=1 Tax=Talaromyces marneffei PM1 TaxID=1077442 RepID=A0A093VUG4_TALMA
MQTRRSHNKSRRGCLECKRRRVKCDETRPQCSNCARRHMTCDYGTSSLVWKDWKEEKTSPQSDSKTPSQDHKDDIFVTLERWTASQGAEPMPVTEVNVVDLELMMHWCNSAYVVLARNEATAWVWRQLVPQEAFSHRFLLWGILSVAALHLSYFRPAEHQSIYLKKAAFHQNRALTLFRESLESVGSWNGKAVFAFSSLVAVYAFGSLHNQEMSDPIQDIYQILVLIRGTNQIVARVSQTLLESDFAPLLQVNEYRNEIPADTKAAIARLHALNDSLQEGPESHKAHRGAIDDLEEMFVLFHGGATSMTPSGKWAIRLSPLYLEYLQERRSFSLVILAHYCVLLHCLRRHWCIAPWPTRVAKAIWNMLDLQHRESIQWAMDRIFDGSGLA